MVCVISPGGLLDPRQLLRIPLALERVRPHEKPENPPPALKPGANRNVQPALKQALYMLRRLMGLTLDSPVVSLKKSGIWASRKG
jgi:hypothetical protein